jgi:cyclic pyranopterin phosphate synthase
MPDQALIPTQILLIKSAKKLHPTNGMETKAAATPKYGNLGLKRPKECKLLVTEKEIIQHEFKKGVFPESTKSRSGGSIAYRYDPSPDVVYVNITNRCTNRCTFCVRQFTPGLSGYVLYLENEPTEKEVWEELETEIKSGDRQLVWCGFGEPTTRLDLVLDVTKRIKTRYPNIKIRLDTDGQAQLRYSSRNVAKELKEAGVNIVSISLNAENEEKYDMLCNPAYPNAYKAILEFARECKKLSLSVRMSVVGSTNVDVAECERIAKELGCEFVIR